MTLQEQLCEKMRVEQSAYCLWPAPLADVYKDFSKLETDYESPAP